MPERSQQTFRITFDITVAVHDIDDALVTATHQGISNGAEIAQWPETPAAIQRDQRLLAALLQHPDLLTNVMRRFAAESLEHIHPDDQSLEELTASALDDGTLIERLRADLTYDDFTYLRHVCAQGAFFDNTTYFHEALTTHQVRFRLDAVSS